MWCKKPVYFNKKGLSQQKDDLTNSTCARQLVTLVQQEIFEGDSTFVENAIFILPTWTVFK